MITGINELKTLTKPISWECKCRFDETKCGITINVDVSVRKVIYVKKLCLESCYMQL